MNGLGDVSSMLVVVVRYVVVVVILQRCEKRHKGVLGHLESPEQIPLLSS